MFFRSLFAGSTTVLTALLTVALASEPSEMTGKWEVRFLGDPQAAPKTIGSMVLDLKVVDEAVSGTVRYDFRFPTLAAGSRFRASGVQCGQERTSDAVQNDETDG